MGTTSGISSSPSPTVLAWSTSSKFNGTTTPNWVNDPLNPLTTSNPFGTNSVCRGFGYQVPDFATVHAGTPTGTFSDLFIDSRLEGQRKLTVYRPAGFDPARSYPSSSSTTVVTTSHTEPWRWCSTT